MPGFEQLLIFVLFGLLSGLIGGFLGVGGGTVYVPVLTAWFGAYQYLGVPFVTFIIGNSLFLTLISGLSGSWKQYKLGNFYLSEVLWVGLSGASTALLTSALLEQAVWFDKKVFSIVFTIILLPLVVRMFLKKEVVEQQIKEARWPQLFAIGLMSGVVSAMTGLGGGVVMVPLLADFLGFPLRRASSVSLGAIVIMATSTVLWYAFQFDAPRLSDWQVGMLALPAVVPMGIGVMLAAPWGVRLGAISKPIYTKTFFLLFFILVILQMHFNIFG